MKHVIFLETFNDTFQYFLIVKMTLPLFKNHFCMFIYFWLNILTCLQYMECIYWTNSKKSHSVIGHVQMLRENWNLAYTGAFVKCPLPETEYGDTITRVSVTTDKAVAGTFEDSIPIISLDDRHKIGEMSVCVKPFHYEFNRAVWLVEFIEFYKILGASKFIFYNHTVGPDVDRVLRYYTQEGSVEVHPWTLPVQSQKVSQNRTEWLVANSCEKAE